MFDSLIDRGFEIEFHSHAKAILEIDFPDAVAELESVLADASVPIEEIIAGGGGEAKGTQRLRRALHGRGWPKTKFEVKKTINGQEREAISHEVDHVARFRKWARCPRNRMEQQGSILRPRFGELQAPPCRRRHLAWRHRNARPVLAREHARPGAAIP